MTHRRTLTIAKTYHCPERARTYECPACGERGHGRTPEIAGFASPYEMVDWVQCPNCNIDLDHPNASNQSPNDARLSQQNEGRTRRPSP